MEVVVYLILGILVTMIGALPFGLVNLSVLSVSNSEGISKAMKVSHGAATIEVLYGTLSIGFGGLINSFLDVNPSIRYLIFGIIGITGIYLLFKTSSGFQTDNKSKLSGLIKGAFLNIISLQVLLYWLLAVTVLYSYGIEIKGFYVSILFLIGVWIGKMGVLWLYAYSSKQILSKSGLISKNINRIIGSILLLSILIQYI